MILTNLLKDSLRSLNKIVKWFLFSDFSIEDADKIPVLEYQKSTSFLNCTVISKF